MPLTRELQAISAELGEAFADLRYIHDHSQPHIHLRTEVSSTWGAVFQRIGRARGRLEREIAALERE